jgi:hypothetical protein
MTSSSTSKTAEEINAKALEKAFDSRYWTTPDLLACRRCGRSTVEHMAPEAITHQLRSLTLRIPPEEGRVKPKEYGFYMCRWCVTEFLKFMMEKKEK